MRAGRCRNASRPCCAPPLHPPLDAAKQRAAPGVVAIHQRVLLVEQILGAQRQRQRRRDAPLRDG
ncbi:MAG: hypothetical protein ACK559_33070, partial [bacterium]